MLNWIKNLFQNREIIKFEDIDNWINEQIIVKEEKQTALIEDANTEVQGILANIPEKLTLLANATYEKPVEPKTMSVINQNRAIFIEKTRKFLDSDSNEIRDKLEKLMESSNKLLHTMKHLYFDQTESILNEFKKISDLFDFLDSKIIKLNLDGFYKMRTDLENYVKDVDKKLKLSDEIKEKETLFAKIKVKLEEMEEELSKLLISEIAKDFSLLTKNSEELQTQMNSLKLSFNSEFSVLEHALKKYYKLALNQVIILDYVKNPINTLIEDQDLKVLEVLSGMKSKIDKLDLKDKKQEKTIEAINYFTRDKFYKFISEHEALNNKMLAVKESLKANTFIKDKDELEEIISDLKKKLDKLNTDIVDFKQIERNIKPDKQLIIDNVENVSEYEVC